MNPSRVLVVVPLLLTAWVSYKAEGMGDQIKQIYEQVPQQIANTRYKQHADKAEKRTFFYVGDHLLAVLTRDKCH